MKIRASITGAAFLMATSAIGPGFITQTTVFTQQLLTSFGFVILLSLLLDIAAQVNIWRIIAVAGKPAQQLANETAPGLGYVLTLLIVIGGVVFNIGNIAGCGLGMQLLLGLDNTMDYPIAGAWISTCIALFFFWDKKTGSRMDTLVKWLGGVMIALTLWTVWKSDPPFALALQHTFLPEKTDVKAILTLVGGTVGGYISFAGAHRLLDAGIHGKENLNEVSRGSIRAIIIATVMRTLLFLAALGVVMKGGVLNVQNPAASVFELAAGNIGRLVFGVVLWCAAITSVVGSAYTSVSFLRSIHPILDNNHRWVTTAFILLSTLIFSFFGKPIQLLVFAGAFNGIILPLALAIMLISVKRFQKSVGYQHPMQLTLLGWVVVFVMSWMAIELITAQFGAIFN
jgi:Mn2+/Fe2+ NRAMP family transporter